MSGDENYPEPPASHLSAPDTAGRAPLSRLPPPPPTGLQRGGPAPSTCALCLWAPGSGPGARPALQLPILAPKVRLPREGSWPRSGHWRAWEKPVPPYLQMLAFSCSEEGAGRIYRWRMEGGARQRQGAGDGGSTQQLAEPGPGPLAPGSLGSAFLFQAGCSSVREFSASRGNSDRKGWSAWLPGPFRSPVGSPPVPGEGCPPGRGAPSCPQNQRSPPPSQLGCSPILSHRNDSVSKAWE